VAGDDDDRQRISVRPEALQQFHAAHARHADIQQQTARLAGLAGIEEGARIAEHPAGQVRRFEQADDRIAHGLVVVDHKNHGLIDSVMHALLQPEV